MLAVIKKELEIEPELYLIILVFSHHKWQSGDEFITLITCEYSQKMAEC